MEEKPTASRNNTPPQTPTWVKIFFIVISLLVLIVIIVHLMGVRFDHGGASGLFSVALCQLNVLQIS